MPIRAALDSSLAASSLASDAAHTWSRVWKCDEPDVIQETRTAIRTLREQVLHSHAPEEAAAKVTAETFRKTAATFSRSTTIGPDDLEIWVWAELPDVVLEPLILLLRASLADLEWAEQLLHNWLVLLPKKLGGHRTIALMCSIVRVTMRILCLGAREWDTTAAVDGDTAAPGVRPVTEVARQFLQLETARAAGKRSACIFWDMAHFYDGIHIESLVQDVPRHSFPPVVASMALQLHMGPRALRIQRKFSHVIYATGQGILPGCSSSTSLARLFLAAPVRIAKDIPEAGGLGIHVDHVSQNFSDLSEQRLIRRAVTAGAAFAKSAVAKKLVISNKSVVVATSISAARRIAEALRRQGLPVKAELKADDLGVGVAPGRRSAKTLNKRLKIGVSRASRAALLRRAAGPAAYKLFATGDLPQQTYAHAVAGLAPLQQKKVLRAATIVTGKAGFQACPHSTAWTKLGRLPTAQLLVDQIRLWTEIWQTTADRAEVVRAWRLIREALAPETARRAWQQTHGPIGATILALKQIGWEPAQADYWVASGERIATLSASEPHAVQDIVSTFSHDAHARVWQDASAHFLGSGLEQGVPSFDLAKAARSKLQRAADKHKAARSVADRAGHPREQAEFLPYALRLRALAAINTGGATVGCRYTPPRPCMRCGVLNETPEHRYFLCADNHSQQMQESEEAIGKTNWISAQFMQQTARPLEPCLWGRGILPASKSSNLRSEMQERHIILGDLEGATSASGSLFTDGSGGPKWIPEALGRVGAGAASFAVDAAADEQSPGLLKKIGLLFTSVPARRTVPRAETWAGARALSCLSTGAVRRWGCDALYMVQGARAAKVAFRKAGPTGDVWCALDEQLQRHRIAPEKVKAHTSLQDVISGHISFGDYFGNQLADLAAGVAATIFQEQLPAIQNAEKCFGLAVQLNLRLAAIEARCWSVAAAELVPAPQLPEVPEAVSPSGARAIAVSNIIAAGHKLYRFRTGFACAGCQRWRAHQHSRRRLTLPCVAAPERAVDEVTLAPGGIDDAECGPELEEAALSQEFEYPEELEQAFAADPGEPEDWVSVTAARAARRRWRAERDELAAADRATASQAAQDTASEVAASSLAGALATADLSSVEGPAWASFSHATHVLYTIEGFVVCGLCGVRASRQIRVSGLTKPCSRRLSAHGRQSLQRLAAGRLPTREPHWPSGREGARTGETLRRIKRPDT